MRKASAYLFVALFMSVLPAFAANALQSGTLRCQGGIVSINDTIAEVLKKCGQPAFSDRREERYSTGRRYGRSYETVTVDDWSYNFGPQEFMYRVVFHNGRVWRIESLDTGY